MSRKSKNKKYSKVTNAILNTDNSTVDITPESEEPFEQSEPNPHSTPNSDGSNMVTEAGTLTKTPINEQTESSDNTADVAAESAIKNQNTIVAPPDFDFHEQVNSRIVRDDAILLDVMEEDETHKKKINIKSIFKSIGVAMLYTISFFLIFALAFFTALLVYSNFNPDFSGESRLASSPSPSPIELSSEKEDEYITKIEEQQQIIDYLEARLEYYTGGSTSWSSTPVPTSRTTPTPNRSQSTSAPTQTTTTQTTAPESTDRPTEQPSSPQATSTAMPTSTPAGTPYRQITESPVPAPTPSSVPSGSSESNPLSAMPTPNVNTAPVVQTEDDPTN